MKPKKPVKKTVNKKNLKDTSKMDILYFIPIIVAIAVVPLIVYMKVNVLQGIQKDMWVGGGNVVDFFSYYKYVVLVFATVAGLFSLLIRKMNSKLTVKKTNVYIPLAVYALFVVISTILSQYRDVATGGFVDRFEGVYTLLAYAALTLVTVSLTDTERHMKYIINALLVSSGVIGLIGLSQYLGIDFFETGLGKELILPPVFQSVADQLRFNFGKFMVYATLYNPNYVGSYVVLTLPVCIGAFMYERKIVKKVILGLLACILLLCIIGSKSMAGLIGLVVTGVLLVVFFRRFIYKSIKPVIITTAVVLILLLGVNFLTGGSLGQRINMSKLVNLFSTTQQDPNEAYIKDIFIKDNKLKIETDKGSVSVIFDKKAISFSGNNNEILKVKNNENTITFEDPAYSLYRFQIAKQGYIDGYIGSKTFKFAINGNTFKLVGLHGKLIDVIHPDKIGFDQQESALTARGFIWSRTIPLLKKTIFVGHGPDTFPIYFPQDDMVGKLNAYGVTNMMVDKPHNLYLQMAMNTGILSMLAFVALLLMYFITSFKLYFKRVIIEYKDYIGISVFCAIFGYSVTGLANDSVVSVAPVFWVLLGLGMAVNLMFKEKLGMVDNIKKSRVTKGLY